MSDDTKSDQEKSKKQLDEERLTSRRSFAKTGIAGGAVLMSLLSRPVLGRGLDPRCTPSVLASIAAGTSLHEGLECDFGCTPGFWCYGQPPDIRAWAEITAGTGITHTSPFSDIFPCGPGPAEFNGKDLFPDGPATTLQDIICIPDGAGPAFLKQSARHAIAAWLNAQILGVFFGPSPGEIVTAYCNAFDIWYNGGAMDGSSGPLESVHSELAALNEQGCPLNNECDNIFYQLTGCL